MFNESAWGAVDYFDAPEVLDASVTPIPGSGGAFLQVVASLAHSCHRILIRDGIGNRFIGLYVGAPGGETLAHIFGVDGDSKVDLFIPKGSRISLRAIGTGSISSGSLCIQFMGYGIGFSRIQDP